MRVAPIQVYYVGSHPRDIRIGCILVACNSSMNITYIT